ncbi:MAG: Hpt domain-containing protein [Loktanella sp.]|nr:Hpt domain-containing protein [Loktanella sp.]
MKDALPDLARVRKRFLSLLEDRCGRIAEHTLAAWQAIDDIEKRKHLTAAGTILHQIAGSAGSLGMQDLGATARSCEHAITEFTALPNAPSETCGHIVMEVDSFITCCRGHLD